MKPALVETLLEIKYQRCITSLEEKGLHEEIDIDESLLDSLQSYSSVSPEEFAQQFRMIPFRGGVALHNREWIIWMFPQIHFEESSTLIFLARNSPVDDHIFASFRASGIYEETTIILSVIASTIDSLPSPKPFAYNEWEACCQRCIHHISLSDLKNMVTVDSTLIEQIDEPTPHQLNTLLHSFKLLHGKEILTLYNSKWIVWINSSFQGKEEEIFLLLSPRRESMRIQQIIQLDHQYNNASIIMLLLYFYLCDKKELKSDGSMPYHK